MKIQINKNFLVTIFFILITASITFPLLGIIGKIFYGIPDKEVMRVCTLGIAFGLLSSIINDYIRTRRKKENHNKGGRENGSKNKNRNSCLVR